MLSHPILLVEDDLLQREPLALLLQLEGYTVTSAGDGYEALAILHAGFAPCVIILDLMMPGMDGAEFRSAQLGDARIANIPVILYSAGDDLSRIANQFGMVGYVVKPGNLDALLSLIAAHC